MTFFALNFIASSKKKKKKSARPTICNVRNREKYLSCVGALVLQVLELFFFFH